MTKVIRTGGFAKAPRGYARRGAVLEVTEAEAKRLLREGGWALVTSVKAVTVTVKDDDAGRVTEVPTSTPAAKPSRARKKTTKEG